MLFCFFLQTGQNLTSKNHYRKADVNQLLDTMNAEWDALVNASIDKGRKLRQAAAQQVHNKTLENAKSKLDELNSEVALNDLGHDLRSCRSLLKKQQGLEHEVSLWEKKINDLVYTGDEMAQDGHFDAESILKQGQLYQARLAQFKGMKLLIVATDLTMNDLNACTCHLDPLLRRRERLEEALKFHEFNFEVDIELQWIRDREPTARSDTVGQDLHTAQSLDKKHKKLEAELVGHQPVIDNTIDTGRQLIQQKHPKEEEVRIL